MRPIVPPKTGREAGKLDIATVATEVASIATTEGHMQAKHFLEKQFPQMTGSQHAVQLAHGAAAIFGRRNSQYQIRQLFELAKILAGASARHTFLEAFAAAAQRKCSNGSNKLAGFVRGAHALRLGSHTEIDAAFMTRGLTVVGKGRRRKQQVATATT